MWNEGNKNVVRWEIEKDNKGEKLKEGILIKG